MTQNAAPLTLSCATMSSPVSTWCNDDCAERLSIERDGGARLDDSVHCAPGTNLRTRAMPDRVMLGYPRLNPEQEEFDGR